MSYEIIKSITFNEKDKTVRLVSESSNVTPKTYKHPWYPMEDGYDYESWKSMFAEGAFSCASRFMPSCKSKAKKTFDEVNESFGIARGRDPWRHALELYPHERDWGNGCWKSEVDEENHRKYEEFRKRWVSAYLLQLNTEIGAVSRGLQ